MKFLSRWLIFLLFVCLPVQNFAEATFLLCQHPTKGRLVFQSPHIHSASHHHFTPDQLSSSRIHGVSHHHPVPDQSSSFHIVYDGHSCDHCAGCCLCCGIPPVFFSFPAEIEKTWFVLLSSPGDQFIPEQLQKPPRTFLA